MTSPESENQYLSDELLIVRDSGEIPEVALHGSIYFLTCDPDGPSLDLEEGELSLLKKMAAARYREIIRRDLEPENRDKGIYRGPARCIANWHRMKRFCGREKIAMDDFRNEVRGALVAFLKREMSDLTEKRRKISVNCSWEELCRFGLELGLEIGDFPAGTREICPSGD